MNGLRKGKILVVGSTNTDMVVRTEHLPRPEHIYRQPNISAYI